MNHIPDVETWEREARRADRLTRRLALATQDRIRAEVHALAIHQAFVSLSHQSLLACGPLTEKEN